MKLKEFKTPKSCNRLNHKDDSSALLESVNKSIRGDGLVAVSEVLSHFTAQNQMPDSEKVDKENKHSKDTQIALDQESSFLIDDTMDYRIRTLPVKIDKTDIEKVPETQILYVTPRLQHESESNTPPYSLKREKQIEKSVEPTKDKEPSRIIKLLPQKPVSKVPSRNSK